MRKAEEAKVVAAAQKSKTVPYIENVTLTVRPEMVQNNRRGNSIHNANFYNLQWPGRGVNPDRVAEVDVDSYRLKCRGRTGKGGERGRCPTAFPNGGGAVCGNGQPSLLFCAKHVRQQREYEQQQEHARRVLGDRRR